MPLTSIWGVDNLSFFESAILNLFFQKMKKKCFISINISRKLTGYHGWDSIFMMFTHTQSWFLMFYTFFRPLTIQNTKLCPTIQNSNLALEIHSLEIMRFLWWKRLKLWKRKRKIIIWTVICPRHRLKFPGNNLELIIKGTMTTIIGKFEFPHTNRIFLVRQLIFWPFLVK